MSNLCRVASLNIGPGQPLAIIAGPCVLESLELGLTVGTAMRDAAHALGLSYIFKGSFDKANRSSISSARGPGLEQGTAWLAQISRELGVPCTTDIHEPHQAEPVARVVDLIQIPAFLCRQTDLLLAAGQAATKHNRAVNVKKGQFISPAEMRGATKKLAEAGCTNVMLTERGTFFGYGRLVNDFIGLGDMMDLGHPVCFDCTHSTQLPGPSGGAGEQTGGRPERAPLLARAAVAAGVHCLFIETHTEPKKSLSDAYTTLTLDVARGVIREAAAIRGALGG
jgi:2-dehydro-3-deoxyphosphooctonate aldolase (KDO 8-P synthase)